MSNRPQERQTSEGSSNSFSRRAIAICAAATLLLAGAVFGAGCNNGDSGDPPEFGDHIPADLVDGFSVGEADAPLTLTVYEDFQCPFCLRYTTTVEPAIVHEYVAEGDLRLEFRNFPILGNESIIAAAGAHCAANENAFWDYADIVFQLQLDEGQLTDEKLNIGRLDTEAVIAIAGQAGLDEEAFEACLTSQETIEALQAHAQSGADIGIRGTPGFVLNGEFVARPPADLDGWRALLDEHLAAAE